MKKVILDYEPNTETLYNHRGQQVAVTTLSLNHADEFDESVGKSDPKLVAQLVESGMTAKDLVKLKEEGVI